MQLKVKKRIRLTEGQWEFLMDIHENQILKLPPVSILQSMFAKRLVANRLVNIVTVNQDGRPLLVYQITPEGKELLNQQPQAS